MKWLRTQATNALVLVALVGVATTGYYFTGAERDARIRENATALTALCALKADLERRHREGVRFLAEHPNGIPGISAAEIRRSLSAQKATIKALDPLDCS